MRCLEPDVARRVQNVAQLAGELLEASGASIAPEIRARITAVLEGNTPSPAHSASAPYATLVRAVATARDLPRVPVAITKSTRSRAPLIVAMIALVALVAWLGARATRSQAPTVTAPAASPTAAPSPPTIQPSPAPAPSASLPPTIAAVSPPAPSSTPKKIFAKPIPVPSAIATTAPPPTTPAPAASPTAPKHPWDDRL